MSSSSSEFLSSETLPLRPIPGGYGIPYFGPVKDRLDYFYNQGETEFFRSKIRNYNSTVFRTNVPPGPFVASNSKVVAVLDAVSFTILFDNSKVEKKDVLVGTFMPSTDFTGGYRVCGYLDPSEPDHHVLKGLFLSFLMARHSTFLPLFRNDLSDLFLDIEDQISDKGVAEFNSLNSKMSFEFMFRLLCDNRRPSDTKLGSDGPKLFDKWLLVQLAPLFTLGFPKVFKYVEDFLLRTLPYPYILVKRDYEKLYEAFDTSAKSFLDEAARLGIEREKACHNLIFLASGQAYVGMKPLFPSLIKFVGFAGEGLHKQLADEIRTVVKSEGGVTFSSLDKMSLTKSVVYEVLRLEPPAKYQFGKAKEDIVVHSHDATYQIKKGETIYGFQPLATRDPRIFENPEDFVSHRFVGEDGEKLLKYVYWSNGRETDNPTADNKQCPGKNLVPLMCKIVLVELFLRYDTFTFEMGTSLGQPIVKIKSLTKATTI